MTSVVSTILLKTMLFMACLLVANVLKEIQLNKIDKFGKVQKVPQDMSKKLRRTRTL